MAKLEENIGRAISDLIHNRLMLNDERDERLVREKICEYFSTLNEEEQLAFERVVITEYLSIPLPDETASDSQEHYEKIMFGLYIFEVVANGRLSESGKMDRSMFPGALQRIYGILGSQGLDRDDKKHQDIVEYASLILTWHAPFDESYRAIERHLDGPLFYDLLMDLAHIDAERAGEISTQVGEDGSLIHYPHVREAPFKSAIYTNASVYDFFRQ